MARLDREMKKGHAIGERIENQAANQLKATYKESEKEIFAVIGAYLAKYSDEEIRQYNRLDKLEAEIGKEVGKMTQRERNIIDASIAAAFLSMHNRTAFGVEGEAQAKLAFKEPLVKAAGKRLSPIEVLQKSDYKQIAIKATTAQTRQQIQRDLIAGLNADKNSYQEITKRVHRTLLAENRNSSLSRAATIVRTECGIARSTASLTAMEHAKEKGVRLKKRWLSATDGRVRDAHAAMDGQEREMEENFVSPSGAIAPAPRMFSEPEETINCRCDMISIVDDFEPEVRRFREEGTIPYRSYGEYAKEKGWKMKYQDFNL